MKLSGLIIGCLATLGAASPIDLDSVETEALAANTSKSWAGADNYFLIGLSDNEQDSYIANLSSYGAKVVRIWVNSQTKGCQKGSSIVTDIPDLETTLRQYNDTVLDAIDKVLVKFVKHGLKAVISPHDANALQSKK
jgi:mannan endo-1,4-beta-mannosidase